MFIFGKRKKRKEAETKRLEELKKQEELKKALEMRKSEEKKQEQTKKVQVEKKPVVKEKPVKVVVKKTITAKYEVFPEAGMFKYRLKASDGDILAVSFGYSSRTSAKNGIDTFRKSVAEGVFEVITDKTGFTRYDLYGARGARVLIIGDFHETLTLAENEIRLIKELYKSKVINDLDEIPEDEVKEELVPLQKVESNPNGKYFLDKVDSKSYFIRLNASNGQLLMVSQRYASKQSALHGLEAIKRALISQNFTIHRDEQNRYQFKLHNDNKQVLVSGETYGNKQRCISSIQSVLRFGGESKLTQ